MSWKKRCFLEGTVFLTILLIIAIYLSFSLLNNPRVYSGVYLDGVHLGGMDKEKLDHYFLQKYQKDFSSMELSIFHKDYPLSVKFEDLNVKVDSEAMLHKVFNIGRQGGFIHRLVEIMKLQKNPVYLETDVVLNMAAVNQYIDEIESKTFITPTPPSLILLESEVYLRSGTNGYTVNKELLRDRILQQVKKQQSGIVIVPVKEVQPDRIDADAFYNQIIQEPKDASIQVINGKVQVIQEVTGRSMEKAAFLSSLAEMEAKTGKYPLEIKLPVQFINPEKNAESLEASLFREKLSVYSTSFTLKTDADRIRAANVRLAVEAINGSIILPGETFSLNGIVEKRIRENGYQPADIYKTDGNKPGSGSGISQVSSTLFNAVLEANLQIDERNAHAYAVSYVPLGRDAAVSYNTQDLKFTNTTNWPVKIEGDILKNNTVQFTLVGTNENPSLKVVIQTSVSRIIPYPTETIKDSSLSSGKKVEQAGLDGAVVDTFFALKNNQTLLSSNKIYSATYQPLPEIIRVPGK